MLAIVVSAQKEATVPVVKIGSFLAAILALATAFSANAANVTLFDASAGTLPSQQGELIFAGFGGLQSVVPEGVLTQSSIGNTAQYGYGTTAHVLDHTLGVRLDFAMRINSESHVGVDRAGFSVILIAPDLYGIEISAWENEVWAQNVGFTHGEGAAFDTTASLTNYSLRLLNGNYTLFADNNLLLSGALRNYSAAGFPYDVANTLFIGDDTTSAQANVTLGDMTLHTTVVPLPPAVALLMSGILGLTVLRRRA